MAPAGASLAGRALLAFVICFLTSRPPNDKDFVGFALGIHAGAIHLEPVVAPVATHAIGKLLAVHCFQNDVMAT